MIFQVILGKFFWHLHVLPDCLSGCVLAIIAVSVQFRAWVFINFSIDLLVVVQVSASYVSAPFCSHDFVTFIHMD